MQDGHPPVHMNMHTVCVQTEARAFSVQAQQARPIDVFDARRRADHACTESVCDGIQRRMKIISIIIYDIKIINN